MKQAHKHATYVYTVTALETTISAKLLKSLEFSQVFNQERDLRYPREYQLRTCCQLSSMTVHWSGLHICRYVYSAYSHRRHSPQGKRMRLITQQMSHTWLPIWTQPTQHVDTGTHGFSCRHFPFKDVKSATCTRGTQLTVRQQAHLILAFTLVNGRHTCNACCVGTYRMGGCLNVRRRLDLAGGGYKVSECLA